MTDHPCRGLSKTAIRAFEMIAIGQHPPLAPKTIAMLVKRGLIVQVGEKVLVRDRFGTVKVPVYEVPTPVHMQWCDWSCEQMTDEEIAYFEARTT